MTDIVTNDTLDNVASYVSEYLSGSYGLPENAVTPAMVTAVLVNDDTAPLADFGDSATYVAKLIRETAPLFTDSRDAEEAAPTHRQPCFCESCFYVTVDNLIGERAVLLQALIADKSYADGLENDMADEIIAIIPADHHPELLAHMLTWEHLHPAVMTVDCLLDETDERSYTALEEMGEVLLAAIRAQGREGAALRELITNEITDPCMAAVHAAGPRPYDHSSEHTA